MADEVRKVSRVKMADGKTYQYFDKDALHIDDEGHILVGDPFIDTLVLEQNLKIVTINGVNVDDYEEIVVRDKGKQLRVRPKNEFLDDIGGYSAKMENSNVLRLRRGKQD